MDAKAEYVVVYQTHAKPTWHGVCMAHADALNCHHMLMCPPVAPMPRPAAPWMATCHVRSTAGIHDNEAQGCSPGSHRLLPASALAACLWMSEPACICMHAWSNMGQQHVARHNMHREGTRKFSAALGANDDCEVRWARARLVSDHHPSKSITSGVRKWFVIGLLLHPASETPTCTAASLLALSISMKTGEAASPQVGVPAFLSSTSEVLFACKKSQGRVASSPMA